MIKRMLATILLLAGTLLAQQPVSQPVTATTAYQLVLNYLQDPITAATTAQKISLINFTNPSDVTAFTNILAGYTQAIAVSNTPATVQTYISILQTQLSSVGYTQLDNFVMAQEAGITTYGSEGNPSVSTYTAVNPENIVDPGMGMDGYESQTWSSGYCGDGTPPPLALSASASGTETKTSGKNFQSLALFVPNSITGFIDSFYFTYYVPYFINCETYYTVIKVTIQGEWATTNFLYTGPNTYCKDGNLWCFYGVIHWCTNTTTPDYDTEELWDEIQWVSWDTVVGCTRFAVGSLHTTWICLDLVAQVGSLSPAPLPCTYNP